MKMLEVYKAAVMTEMQALIEAEKLPVMEALEEKVELIVAALQRGLKKGAAQSEEKWDDMVVAPAVDFLVSRITELTDKIDGKEG